VSLSNLLLFCAPSFPEGVALVREEFVRNGGEQFIQFSILGSHAIAVLDDFEDRCVRPLEERKMSVRRKLSQPT
jgi:hypothetical protein